MVSANKEKVKGPPWRGLRTYQLRFVLAGPSGFTRLSLVFLLRAVQECGASFSFLLSSRSNATGEREIGVGTVTAPFSRVRRPTDSPTQRRYFQPPRDAERSSCGITTGNYGVPRILFNGCVRPI